MQKIDFVNSQQPALNDTNLNLMQDYIETAINAQVSGDTLPVGSIMPYGSDTIPDNWLLCNGQAVSRTTYSILFQLIGTTYGVGDGSTTFNLPDLRTRVPLGKGTATGEGGESYNFQLGNKGGEYSHILTSSELPSMEFTTAHIGYSDSLWTSSGGITHTLTNGHGVSGTNDEGARENENDGKWHKYSLGEGHSHNNLQPFTVINYIIKAQQSAGIVATVVDNVNSTSATNALSAKQGKLLSEKTHLICCNMTENVSATTDYSDITNWQSIKNIGDSFTVNNGVIKVNFNGDVKVAVKCHVYSTVDNNNFFTRIRKNNTDVYATWAVQDKIFYNETVYNQATFSVSTNDTITISIYGEYLELLGTTTTIIVERI